MGWTFERDDTCAVCGTVNRVTHVFAASSLPATHLDGRLAAMGPCTMSWWVTRCAQCGYCAGRIDWAPKVAAEVVRSAAYRRQLEDARLPVLARSCLCAALIAKAADGPASRGIVECHMRAAWVCDDAASADAAIACRLRAAAALRVQRRSGRRKGPDFRGDTALLADLCRRAGRFEEAAATARAGLPGRVATFAGRLLELQLRLVAASDTGVHRLHELGGADAKDLASIGWKVHAVGLASPERGIGQEWYNDRIYQRLAGDASVDSETFVDFLRNYATPFLDYRASFHDFGPFLWGSRIALHSPDHGEILLVEHPNPAPAPLPQMPWVEDSPRVNVVGDRYRGTQAYVRVLCEIAATAERQGTITCADLALLMGIRRGGVSMHRAVSRVLAEICEDEVNRGRPMLGAVVLGCRGRPARGFFTLAQALGLLAPDEDEATFWKAELEAVHEVWRRPDPKA
ncbi:MAG: hypothetical protein WCP98_06910 [Actinomycetes bacterium]